MTKAARSCAVGALLLGLGFTAAGVSQVAARSDSFAPQSIEVERVHSTGAQVNAGEASAVEQALIGFVSAMAAQDAAKVWAFASEEEQAAFETEQALLSAYAQEFPALTEATELRVQSYRDEGDTPFVKVVFRDAANNGYVADLGFWLDDAGDWKVVSCDIVPTTDQIAAL